MTVPWLPSFPHSLRTFLPFNFKEEWFYGFIAGQHLTHSRAGQGNPHFRKYTQYSSVDTCMRTHEYVHLTWKLQIWDLRLREGCCETAVLLVPFTERCINGMECEGFTTTSSLSLKSHVCTWQNLHEIRVTTVYNTWEGENIERGRAKNLFPVLFLGAEAESDRKQKKGERKGKLCLWGKTSNEGREQLRNLALLQQ